MKHLIRNIILILIISSISQASDLINILSPDERVSINKSNIYIIGKTPAPIVEIWLNNNEYSQSIVKDSVFHAQVSLGFGLHEVKIIPVFSGMAVSNTDFATVEIMYAPLIESKYKRLYPTFTFHNDETKTECLGCHNTNHDYLSDLNGSSKCSECHRSITENYKDHTKSENKSCGLCHEFGKNLETKFSSQNISNNPCYNCHQDKIKSFDQKYVHGPVAGGSCIICHAPHGSKYGKNLQNSIEVLCVSCHENISQEMDENIIMHKPFIEGQCNGCHDPHATNNEWVLKKSSEILCLNCHKPDVDLINHEHPYNIKPKKKVADNIELTNDGLLECLSCHNPHSSKQPHMLKSNMGLVCIGCHTDL